MSIAPNERHINGTHEAGAMQSGATRFASGQPICCRCFVQRSSIALKRSSRRVASYDEKRTSKRQRHVSQHVLFQPRKRIEHTIEHRCWHPWRRRSQAHERLDKVEEALHRVGPVKEVACRIDAQPGSAGNIAERLLIESCDVLINDIVISPESRKCGHSSDERTCRREETERTHQGCYRILDVLEDVEHQNNIVLANTPKLIIEWLYMNARTIRAVGTDQ